MAGEGMYQPVQPPVPKDKDENTVVDAPRSVSVYDIYINSVFSEDILDSIPTSWATIYG